MKNWISDGICLKCDLVPKDHVGCSSFDCPLNPTNVILAHQNDEITADTKIKELEAEVIRLKQRVNDLIDTSDIPRDCPHGERKFCQYYQSDQGHCLDCTSKETI